MCNFVITDDEIVKAESAVLPEGSVFNEDQRSFIKCLDSCSVQAYAGTGKTSTLVGKLHVLAQKQAWVTGRGICVLSHTNVAVDEVKKSVANHFPGIMEYPNFIGTIQEFVNTFLFSPYLAHHGNRIRSQDSECHIDWQSSNDDDFKNRVRNKINQLRGAGAEDFIVKGFYREMRTIHDSSGQIMCRDSQGKLVEYTSLSTNAFSVDRLYVPLKDLINSRRSSGRFLFDESFVDAKEYIEEFPAVINIMRERFGYVFLDEAQDCSELQLEILNRIFSNTENVLFQQIGDENQEITDDKWTPGEAPLALSESVRFGVDVSSFINKFKISGETNVVGVGPCNTEQVLITYTDSRKNDVLSEYAALVSEKEIPTAEGEGFYCIASEHKVLENFYPSYSRDLVKVNKRSTQLSFKNDDDCIRLLNKEYLIKYGHNHIFNILFSLLYKYYREEGEWYELRKILREGDHSQVFKILITQIVSDINKNGHVTNTNYISEALNTILGDNQINLTDHGFRENRIFSKQNIFVADNEILINLGTIHSVKGQTHNATLHLSDSKKFGAGNLKSDFEWSLGETVTSVRYKRHIYVAASRPRNLFVSAIHSDLYRRIEDKELFDNFERIDLT